ncbi:MAG TPA: hypothetical protein VMM93_08985 [Vicinamibacterales bacterium]|nr:hypothetical protein [Vicinamibacterales bacterium]
MTSGPAFWIGLVASAAGLATSAGVLSARDARFAEPPFADRLLYVQSGEVADRLLLQFDAVAADVYWIRAIQHFGRDRRSSRPDRFTLLEPLLDLTTTLDPHFNVAYRFGAIFLAVEPPDGAGRPDQAIALLEKGLRESPDRWQLAHDLGFVHYWFTGETLEAARWFERAGAMPGAPAWVLPLAAVTRAQGGDRDGARRLLGQLAGTSETYVRNAAERGLLQLQALDALDQLQVLIAEAHARLGRAPASWADVFPDRPGQVPLDPAGVPFVYDPERGRAVLSPDSRLHPLPVLPVSR